MTSYERVQMTLEHKEPDRVPYDLSGSLVTGIHWKAYDALRSFLGLEKREIRIWDLVQGLARCDEDLLRALNVDTRGLLFRSGFSPETDLTTTREYEQFTDTWGITWRRMKPDGLYFDIVRSPLADKTLEEVKKWNWPDPKDESRLTGLQEQAEHFSQSDKFVMLGATGWTAGLLQQYQWLMGYEQAFYALAGDEPLADFIIGTLAEQDIEFWRWAIPLLHDDISLIVYADDFGFQNGPAMSHSMFEQYFKERYRKIFKTIKTAAPHVKIFFHTCGASRFIIPDLIEVGVDILNPVQVTAHGMDTKSLKKDFGKDIVFWGGGIDTQYVLPRGSVQEVTDEVTRRIEDLAPGGGFVFTPVHNIQADVPPENIMAMWETLQQYGVY